MTQTDKLLEYISRLGPVEFCGLARVLKVPLYKDEEKKEYKEFTQVLEEILINFEKCNRTRKRELVNLVKKASKNPIKAADPFKRSDEICQ